MMRAILAPFVICTLAAAGGAFAEEQPAPAACPADVDEVQLTRQGLLDGQNLDINPAFPDCLAYMLAFKQGAATLMLNLEAKAGIVRLAPQPAPAQ